MAILTRLVDERTDLTPADTALLNELTEEWSLLADLALSDLVLWVPTWNEGGLLAVALVRPTTAPTSVPEDIVGAFAPRGRHPQLDQAAAFGRPIAVRDIQHPSQPAAAEAYPIRRGGRVIGVVARHSSPAPRVAGRLEEIYLSSADDLFGMLVDGAFPLGPAASEAGGLPRVGDGIVRLDAAGLVTYASPNAVSAMRRLGLATDLTGSAFAELAVRLSHRPGPMDDALSAVASGRVAGRSDIENQAAVVVVHGLPLIRDRQRIGALVFVHDATDVRRRERALISKDATIREIHHRVKNNLQTVAAMLRLQARRADSAEAKEVLVEAELRVGAIAVVHEILSSQPGEEVAFDDIIDRVLGLVRDVAPAYADGRVPPVLLREGSWGDLAADYATPLAMAVSELVHNAAEHAHAARVVVRLGGAGTTSGIGRDQLVLTVADDGRGLPEGFDPSDAGLGLSIVQSLVAADLSGTCEFESSSAGTTVVLTVPMGTRDRA